MIFNSFQFLWLFPIIFITYYFVMRLTEKKYNAKISNFLLIAISYGLYVQWVPMYALVLLTITAITYISALLIERNNAYGCKKYLIFTGATFALLPLLIFKYTGFICETFVSDIEINLIAPLGISFYTFQAVGYLLDVYYKRTEAEHDWWNYMLFVSFFPQILSGPISKASELLLQIKANRKFDEVLFVKGLKWLLWGMFLKVAVADRLGLIVSSVYSNYDYCSGTACLIASIMYTFQIYADFAGYSFMALGVGELLGFELINNFNRPYFASSITEFWRRWHISLTRWLTQNVYIPMGGNRCGTFRQHINIIVTFLVSGFWHGANWTFVAWGGLHGILQIVEKALGVAPKGKFSSSKLLNYLKPLRILVTFFIVNLLWIFFRMPTITDAVNVILKIFTEQDGDISTFLTWKILILPLYILIFKEVIEEFSPRTLNLWKKNMLVRWSSYLLIVVVMLLMGVFDAGQFIYVSF